MDLTSIFKASVKAVRLRNKITSSTILEEQRKLELVEKSKTDKNRILQKQQKHKQPDEFSKSAKDVCKKITELRNLLIENRAAYMRFAQHLKDSAQMTDEQRNIIDRESERFFNYYTQFIGQLQCDWKCYKLKKQRKEHLENVIELLRNYLTSVRNLHMEQKRYRMERELETYKFLKLASDKKNIPIRFGTNNNGNNKKQRKISEISNQSSSSLDEKDDIDDIQINRTAMKINDNNDNKKIDKNLTKSLLTSKTSSSSSVVKNDDKMKSIRTKQIALDDDNDNSQKLHELNDLSPEDIQMFELENDQLYQELQGLSEEVEQIEKNVVDIAKLQTVFTEKISLQKHDIERIANAVVSATENVIDANEQIKQAIQRNAGLRVWSLFFLLVMSFTLLFLDWYND